MDYLELVETYRQLEATTKRLQKTFLLAEFLKKSRFLPKARFFLTGMKGLLELPQGLSSRRLGSRQELMLRKLRSLGRKQEI